MFSSNSSYISLISFAFDSASLAPYFSWKLMYPNAVLFRFFSPESSSLASASGTFTKQEVILPNYPNTCSNLAWSTSIFRFFVKIFVSFLVALNASRNYLLRSYFFCAQLTYRSFFALVSSLSPNLSNAFYASSCFS